MPTQATETMRNITTAIVGLMTATVCLTGCGDTSPGQEPTSTPTATTPQPPAATVEVAGQLRLYGSSGFAIHDNGYSWCVGEGGFDDLYYGAQVTVFNSQQEKVAIGELDEGKVSPDKNQCWFDFTVPDVPDEPGVFTLQIAERGGAQDFTINQYRDQPGMFTLFLEAEDFPSMDDPWTTEDGLTQEEADCLNSKPDTNKAWEECVSD